MRNVALGLVGTLGLFLFGCAPAEPASQTQQKLGTISSHIFHGTADTTHTAVVALLSDQSECSGTIIKVSGNTGYVLTAAHCVPANDQPKWAVQANDYNDQSAIVYQVTATKAHPSYNGDTYDFGMVTITGVGPDTPVLPAMTKDIDNLKVGSPVDFVGYGLTENDDPNSPNVNSLRRQFMGTVDGEVTTLQLKYSQTTGGPCEGDSGGPSLSTVGGKEYVSGVTSYGDQACVQYGVSGRVSGVYDSFIGPYINGSSPPPQTCQECGNAVTGGVGACTSAVKDCQNDADCTALNQCFGACASGDQACLQSCATAHKTGLAVYEKINSCICDTGCKAECASDPSCQATTGAMCAYTFPDATCGTCADGMCCDAQKACADDTVCNACITTQGATGCDTNANLKALTSCLQTSCKTPCASLFGGAAMCAYTFPDATCGTCADGMCCDAQKACEANANCNACVTTGMGTNCAQDPLANAMFMCLETSCKEPCASLFGGGTGGSAGAGQGGSGGGISTGGTSSGGSSPFGGGGTNAAGTSSGGSSPFGGGGTSTGGTAAAGTSAGGTAAAGAAGGKAEAGTSAGGTSTTGGAGGTTSSAGGATTAGGSTGDGSTDSPAATPQDSSSSSGCSVATPRNEAGGLSASLLLGFAALLGAGRRRRNRG